MIVVKVQPNPYLSNHVFLPLNYSKQFLFSWEKYSYFFYLNWFATQTALEYNDYLINNTNWYTRLQWRYKTRYNVRRNLTSIIPSLYFSFTILISSGRGIINVPRRRANDFTVWQNILNFRNFFLTKTFLKLLKMVNFKLGNEMQKENWSTWPSVGQRKNHHLKLYSFITLTMTLIVLILAVCRMRVTYELISMTLLSMIIWFYQLGW